MSDHSTNIQDWLSYLTTPTKIFELHSPLPMQECLVQLRNLETHQRTWSNWLRSYSYLPLLCHSADGTAQFTLRKMVGRNLYVQATGQLIKGANQSTFVVGYAEISMVTRVIVFVSLIPALLVGILFLVMGGYLFASFPLLVVLSWWFFCLKERDKLLRDLPTILHSEVHGPLT